jgi:parvulin-like peptidyl-prolyl isomerase
MAQTKKQPTKAKIKRVSSKSTYLEATQGEENTNTTSFMPGYGEEGVKPKRQSNPVIGAVIIGIILVVILLAKNGLIVSAVVNGHPIPSWQFYQTMAKRYGQQTLEGLITEKLIADAASKEGVSVSQNDINSRENEMVKNVGGDVKLDDLLKYQGITKNDFDSQIRMQLSVERILSKKETISNSDIDNFIATNSGKFVASDTAGMREEAKKAILDQKIGAEVQPWFDNLKKNAKILKFL